MRDGPVGVCAVLLDCGIVFWTSIIALSIIDRVNEGGVRGIVAKESKVMEWKQVRRDQDERANVVNRKQTGQKQVDK